MTQSTQVAAVANGSDIQHAVFESLTLKGDISNLNAQQKAVYLERLCTSLGLNPLTQPFVPLKLSGKEVLYASRGCTDQLASIHKLTREIIRTERIEDVYVATCKVTAPDGRFDISTGAVTIGNLKADALANALMKAETKAKRRATLCFCGLGFLDESEIETIPQERIERIATKGALVEAARSEPAAPSDAAIDNAMSREHLGWRKQIDSLGFRKMVEKYDAQPENREAIYTAVLREAVKRVIASDGWSLTEDGTAAYLEKFGITAIDEASRGQLEAAIADLRELGNL